MARNARGHGAEKGLDLLTKSGEPAHFDRASWVGGVFDVGLRVAPRTTRTGAITAMNVWLEAPRDVRKEVAKHMDRYPECEGVLFDADGYIPAALQWDVLSRVVLWMRSKQAVADALSVCVYRADRKLVRERTPRIPVDQPFRGRLRADRKPSVKGVVRG